MALALALLGAAGPADAQVPPTGATCDPLEGDGCGADAGASAQPVASPSPATRAPSLPPLLFFWGVGCSHCRDAAPLLDALARELPHLRIERVEIRRDPAGRARFFAEVERLRIGAPGIPLFVLGERYVLGYREGVTDEEVRAMIRDAAAGRPIGELSRIELPLVGALDPRALSLPRLALLIGFVDGVNPCAMYVLVALLGILLHVRSRARLFLFGGTFVATSGVVYFLFMTAWLELFTLAGLGRGVTIALGVALVAMGLVNLKELVWLGRGVSLTIPDRAKPGLFRRMRAVAFATSLPTAMVGIATLAFVVNLVELGCTLGLPAVYTRILSLHPELSVATRRGYLALYNLAYVLPLALIVVVYALTLHRLTLTERGAKALKGVSGALLLGFGVFFVLRPEILQ